MVTAVQAVPLVGSASSLATVARVSELSLGGNPSLAAPSAILTLGARASAPLTFNAAGLFESLSQLAADDRDAAPSAPASTAPADGRGAISEADLAALLGLSTSATSSGALNSAVRQQTLPSTTGQALAALLSLGGGTVSSEQAVANLLAIGLNTAATGLDSATSDASVFSATGLLQAVPSGGTARSLDGLRTADLGLAALALGVNSSSGGLLDSAGSLSGTATDAAGQSLMTVLDRNVSLATVPIDSRVNAAADATSGPTAAALDNLLLANLNVGVAERGGVVAAGGVATAATAATNGAGLLAVAPATPAAVAIAPAIAATPTAVAAAPAAGNAPVAVTATAAATTATATTAAPPAAAVTANTAAGNVQLNPAAQALSNVAANPAYAIAASALYMSAMVFRAQQASPTVSTTFYASKPVMAVRAVRPI